jgi:lysophospholipase L1-like esterase
MRHPATKLAALMIAATAWACGESASPTMPTPPLGTVPLESTRLSRTLFLAFGDSLTAGEVASSAGTVRPDSIPSVRLVIVPTASYPTQLSTGLRTRYPTQSPAIDVINSGMPNEWAQDGVQRFRGVLTNTKAEALLLLEGYNDLAGQGQAGIGPASRALESMTRDARARGLRVFLATLTPSRAGTPRAIPAALIATLNASIQNIAVAQGALVVDLFTAIGADIPRYIGADGLHPTEAGYRRIAEVFLDVIRRDLEVRTNPGG